MPVGLLLNGKYLGLEPGTTRVYADRPALGAWEEVVLTSHGAWWDVRFGAANRQLTVTPDRQLDSRPAGTFGEWEQFILAADRLTLSRAGVTLTIHPPPAPALHLEQRGYDFVNAQGQRIILPGVDGFDDLWFRTTGRESELDALMKESRQLSFVVRRIWCGGDAGLNQVFSLYPQNIPGFFDLVRSLVAYENSYGQIPLFNAFVDAQRVWPSASDRRRFWAQLNEALLGSGAYLMSGGNQYPKNGFNPWDDLADPGHGVIWSRGSSTEDLETGPRGASASELHATRASFDRALMDSTASPPEMRKPPSMRDGYPIGGSGMVWMTEGNPFGDSAGYTEKQARQLGAAYAAGDWAMAVHHNRQSQRGQLMHDDTARTAAAWVQGMTKGMFL